MGCLRTRLKQVAYSIYHIFFAWQGNEDLPRQLRFLVCWVQKFNSSFAV